MLRFVPTAAFVLVLLLTAGCDGTEPAPPEPFFEATLHDVQEAASALQGTARLDPGAAFDRELFVSVPLAAEEDLRATVVLLTASTDGAEHTIVFSHLGDDRPAAGETLAIEPQVFSTTRTGEAAARREASKSDDTPALRETLRGKTFAAYAQTTSDSLFTYLPSGGTLTIERASEREMTGTFVVEIAALHAVARDAWPPSGSGTLTEDDFPGRIEHFADPTTLEGTFTAVLPE